MTSLYRYVSSVPKLQGPVALTLGSFDGLHLGHQALIRRLAEFEGATRVLISFYPHPDKVLGKATVARQLSTLSQRMQLLQQLKVDIHLCLHFTDQLSRVTASDFLQQVLLDRLGATHVVLGPDARVGHKGEGTPEFICEYLGQRGCAAEVMPFLTAADGQRISSGLIRQLVRDGRVQEVPGFFGRPYSLEGRVRRGDQRGRTLGFPTANVYAERQELPRAGVYLTRTLLGGRAYPSITNLGYRPTFSPKSAGRNAPAKAVLVPLLETHLLRYQGSEFYRERIEVQFLRHLRDEQRFSGGEALRQQLELDRVQALAYFTEQGESL